MFGCSQLRNIMFRWWRQDQDRGSDLSVLLIDVRWWQRALRCAGNPAQDWLPAEGLADAGGQVFSGVRNRSDSHQISHEKDRFLFFDIYALDLVNYRMFIIEIFSAINAATRYYVAAGTLLAERTTHLALLSLFQTGGFILGPGLMVSLSISHF